MGNTDKPKIGNGNNLMSLVRRVTDLFEEADSACASFQKKTSLECIPMCGQCCAWPYIESTVLELLPMAVRIWKNGGAEYWLRKIELFGQPGKCLFHEVDSKDPDNGRCSFYAWRPLRCRLYAFSADVDKGGNKVFIACPRIEKNDPRGVSDARDIISRGGDVPLMPVFFGKLAAIDPESGQKAVPIHEAMKTAIEKVGFFYSYRCGD